MKIKQWEDESLAHFSYAVLSECEQQVVLIDPARDARQYIDYAKENNATIIGVIETHPHADFVSSHVELHEKTGATIYTSKLAEVEYPHQSFDEGDELAFGKIKLVPLNTPGHSPDSICILLQHQDKQKAIFTGDTLFIGDCGRPDLREDVGKTKASGLSLAKQMYHSLRDKLAVLNDDVIVYPAHGAGTLCGKALSDAKSSTIGEEKKTNWSLQAMSEEEFVHELLKEQPFVPAYFKHDVEMNRKGATHFEDAISTVKIASESSSKEIEKRVAKDVWVVDGRDEKTYKQGHLPHSINIMEGKKFDTWLGSIIKPEEPFYLAANDEDQLKRLIERAAAIGYESQIKEAFILKDAEEKNVLIDFNQFKQNPSQYTIVDVRNPSETAEKEIFPNSIKIPLPDLREKANTIPTEKPIVVHCAAGYRSAAASSLLQSILKDKATVLDLGENVKQFI